MNGDSTTHSSLDISLMPKSGPCYDFSSENYRTKKTIWLVPHVIKYKEESEVITWRCNWGNVCEAKCLYAMAKDRNWTIPVASPVPNKI
jgi:hypothetical protein